MSHNVEMYSYPEKVNRDKVKRELDNYVAHADWQEGCSGLCRDIRWMDAYAPLPDREAAQRFIEEHDRGSYDQLAVRYYAALPFTDSKRKLLEQRQKEAYAEWEKRDDAVYPKTLKSAYLGCKGCGSRLSTKHLRGNKCPVCGKDLRPESTLKSIAAAKARWERAGALLQQHIQTHARKEICWLVKIEYHT